MSFRLQQIRIILIGLLLMCIFSIPTLAQQGSHPGGPPSVGEGAIGKITAVSDSSITVEKRDGSDATFTISSATTVTLNGQPSAVSNLATGECAAVSSTNGTAATAVDVRTMPSGGPPSVGKGAVGEITAVGTTSITVEGRSGTTATFTISSATTVTLNGQPSAVSDLATGEFAAVSSTDGTAATSINVHSAPPSVGKEAVGEITDVSATSITVRGPQGDTKTFTVSSSTTVTLNGKTSAAGDLATGEFAAVTSTDGAAATAIAARSGRPGGPPSVSKGAVGKITAVSDASITIEKRGSTTVTFTITSATTVTVDGDTSSASDLTVDECAAVTSTDGTTATAIAVRTMPPSGGSSTGIGIVRRYGYR